MARTTKITEFKYIPGLTGKCTENSQLLELSGGEDVLNTVRQFLTATNTSVQYRIKQLEKNFAKGYDTANMRAEYHDLKQKQIITYFCNKDGHIYCPAGFWWLCEKIDNHVGNIPYCKLPDVDGKSIRQYQEEACQKLLRYKRAMISLSTGAGKTILTCALVHCMLQANKRVTVIVPTINLVNQTFTVLKSYFGDQVGAIGGQHKWKPGCNVYVSTIHSVQNVIDVQDAVIIDETHHSSSDQYIDAMAVASAVEYCYGLTATPVRADGLILGVHAHCGPVVYSKDASWCIQNGFLVPVKVRMVHISNIGIWSAERVLSAKAYQHLCRHNRCLQIVTKLITSSLNKNLKTLVVYKTEKEGQVLARHLAQQGIETEVAHSKFRSPLKKFQANETPLLISNMAFLGEGVDVPNIDCVIDITQAASEGPIRQLIGRGLRTSPGKSELMFISVVLHGYGDTKGSGPNRKWYDLYEGYSAHRVRIYRELTSDITEISL
jgi:superfamily II DNA or RNA helicase